MMIKSTRENGAGKASHFRDKHSSTEIHIPEGSVSEGSEVSKG